MAKIDFNWDAFAKEANEYQVWKAGEEEINYPEPVEMELN
jgi:hypothetical protein